MKRALVLGEGGGTGSAWEIGIVKGLLDGGINLNEADLITGTSAGARIGALIRLGRDFNELYNEILTIPAVKPKHLQKFDEAAFREIIKLMNISKITTEVRRRIGHLALSAKASDPEQFVEFISRELGDEWPEKLLTAVGVDADDGTVTGFNNSSGITLGRAVAISMCVPCGVYPVTFNGRRYMDGAMAGDNLLFASGYDNVVVIVTRDKAQSRTEVQRLKSTGSNVFYFSPDEASLKAIGKSALSRFDPAGRAPAAKAGLKQAPSMIESFKTMWI
jgi:NTE family protein